MTVKEVAELTGGRILGGDPTTLVGGVSIDTRTLARGELFVALAGEKVDGHAFLAAAAAAGASCILIREARGAAAGVAVVSVADPAAALIRLAVGVRARLAARVVAITGSSGKTMTKDLTAAVARSRYEVTASASSYNNEIGVPLTVLSAGPSTEVLVAEIASRGVGHIAALVPVLAPDVGVVLNVGPAHIGMFGSLEAVARAKGELVEGLDDGTTAILNADDPAVVAMASRTRAAVVTFGTNPGADVRAEVVSLGEDGCATFTLASGDERASVRLRIPGEHVTSDALAAAAAGRMLGVELAAAAEALSAARGSAWRMEVTNAPGGWRVINDAYNSNPASASAAVRALVAIGRGARTWAVLGPMAELGPHAPAEHDRIGALVARLGIARLVVVGEDARGTFEAARREGMTAEACVMVAGVDDAIAHLARSLASGDVVLVKASRAAALERVAFAIGARAASEGAA